MAGKNGLHAELACQRRQIAPGGPVQYDKPAGTIRPLGHRPQGSVQLHQRFADELHTAVRAGQGVQDFAIKNKRAMNLRAMA